MADGGAVTIDPNASETVNGLATLVIPNGTSAEIICDGTSFFTNSRTGIWEPVGLFTLSAATSLVITEQAASQYLRIKGRLTQSAAGILIAQVSTDNGATFDTGANYFSQSIAAAATTVAAGTLVSATGLVLTANSPVAANTDYPLEAEIMDFNQVVTAAGFSRSSPVVSAVRNQISNSIFHLGTSARNALRILNASGGTISGRILIERMRG
jgi:hypothetical protein